MRSYYDNGAVMSAGTAAAGGGGRAAAERIVIAGGGIAGLAAALALNRAGRRVTLIDRDSPPPEGSADELFAAWRRPGALQLRHSHGFFGRLRNLLLRHYPELYRQLLAAGARERSFADGLPPWLRQDYRPRRGDDEMTGLYCRRATFERTLYLHVRALPAVDVLAATRVTGLRTRRIGGQLAVTGVEAQQGERQVLLECDALIDACGLRSPFLRWLRAAGAVVAEETHPTAILYFTRFYRLRPGGVEPDGLGHPRVGDLGYLKFGIFPADNGTFSLTLVVPAVEKALAVLRRGDLFERACAALPLLAAWTAQGKPLSEVLALGGQDSLWRRFVAAGRPAALGYFAVGEAALRANPLYGSGCTLTFVHAHLLADALAAGGEPVSRARRFDAATREVLHPFYRKALQRDRDSQRRARRHHDGGEPAGRRERVVQWVAERGITLAMRGDLTVRRAIFRDMHLLDQPGRSLRRPGVWLRVLYFIARGRGRNAAFELPPLGPPRLEMLRLLGLAPRNAD